MTTYTLQGIRQDWDINDNVTGMTSAQLEVVLDVSSDGTFSYVIDALTGDLPDVDITASGYVSGVIDGGINADNLDAQIGRVDWNGNTTLILAFTTNPPPGVAPTDWYFVLGGTALPDFASAPDPVKAFSDFEAQITFVGPITTGPFAPSSPIAFSGLPNTTSTENDKIIGSALDDVFGGGLGRDIIKGLGGDDTLNGGAGKDRVDGGTGADILKGGGQNDLLLGGSGRDDMDGGAGSDVLKGGGQNDKMVGRGGRDKFDGGTGNDLMIGGAGVDTFIFSKGDDKIKDFKPIDKINLKGVASITGFNDLIKNHTTDVGGNLVIDDGAGNTLTLIGVTEASLVTDDFLF